MSTAVKMLTPEERLALMKKFSRPVVQTVERKKPGPAPKEDSMRGSFSVKVSDEMIKNLRALCVQTGFSKSEVLRMLLRTALRQCPMCGQKVV